MIAGAPVASDPFNLKHTGKGDWDMVFEKGSSKKAYTQRDDQSEVPLEGQSA